jgi:hypothetical protein
LRVEISIFVCKLDSACRNHTLRVKSHSPCINYGRECHYYTNTRQNYTRVCGNYTLRVEIARCVWKLDFTSRNHTLRIEVTLCVTVVHVNITCNQMKNKLLTCFFLTLLRGVITLIYRFNFVLNKRNGMPTRRKMAQGNVIREKFWKYEES